MPLLSLGWFAFSIETAPFEAIKRASKQRWASKNRMGQRAAMQNCGPGEDTITLDCTIAPQVTGPISGLDRLRQMMADGKAWILTAGSGDVMGPWVITGIDETRRHLLKDGTPRKIEFTLSLAAYPEDQPQGLGRLRDSLP